MTDTTSYIEMLRKFGSDLGLPKMNVDELIETQKKNIEPWARARRWPRRARSRWRRSSAKCSRQGCARRQTLAREYKPLGKVQENLALQTEFARKVFDIAVKGAQESATDRAAIDHRGR